MVEIVHTVVSDDYPTEVPPTVGCHYIMPNAFFFAAGAAHPEDWVQIWGEPSTIGINAGGSITPDRMVRSVYIGAHSATAPTAPLTTVVTPAWPALPRGFGLVVDGIGAGVTVPVDVDFSAMGSNCSFDFQGELHGVTAHRDGAVLKLQIAEPVAIKLVYLEWSYDEDGVTINGIYASMTVTPQPAITPVESV